ncbi:MAG: hypothetical protein SF053_19910 [Bacteroidia bacterium]|nr:hypothetical protein [Bacteroidia bacterium]
MKKQNLLLCLSVMLICVSLHAQPYPRQWLELRLTGYHFPDFTARRLAFGYDPARAFPLYMQGRGASLVRVWAQSRLLTRLGYDYVYASGAPSRSPEPEPYIRYRRYHTFTAMAGPAWRLGSRQRHLVAVTVGGTYRRGNESYLLGCSTMARECHFTGRRPRDWGVTARAEYHFVPVRFAQIGIFGQYQRYLKMGGLEFYGWPAGLDIPGLWTWGVSLGIGY